MLLSVRGLRAGYGEGDVLRGVDLDVEEGSVVTLLGPNGAGKSTLLRALAGFAAVSAGRVELRGIPVTGHEPSVLARCGLYLVPERRAVFPNLTVADNLRLATAAPEASWRDDHDRAVELFPRLRERWHQLAGTLSGGEQQMLALARAFAARPTVLLLDEPSLGLAPKVVDEVFEAIDRFRQAGIAVILVEQYVERALAVADTAAVLAKGEIAWQGDARNADLGDVEARYLGRAPAVSSRSGRGRPSRAPAGPS